jgi:hypothetical protein
MKTVAAILITLVTLVGGYAQEIPKPRIVGEPGGLTGNQCHTTILDLDDAMVTAQLAGKNTTIILSARLGKGESSRRLNRERLRQLIEHMIKNRAFSSQNIVTAEGARVNGLGQVDVYVGGKPYLIFKVKRNKDFAKGCVPLG